MYVWVQSRCTAYNYVQYVHHTDTGDGESVCAGYVRGGEGESQMPDSQNCSHKSCIKTVKIVTSGQQFSDTEW